MVTVQFSKIQASCFRSAGTAEFIISRNYELEVYHISSSSAEECARGRTSYVRLTERFPKIPEHSIVAMFQRI